MKMFSSLILAVFVCSMAFGEQVGGLRGFVSDKDFDAAVPLVQVLIAETGEKTQTNEEGNYVFGQLKAGSYTIMFSKDGYTRQLKSEVVVSPGRMTDLDITLSGDFTEMEEFVVQELQMGGGTEIALLNLRMEAPALIDSVSSDLMSQAGASDAASALKLIAGTTVQDGKYAVVRGLPDRYVNSQMNGVRLPTADADKRAVQLDQFPSSIIESIQVSKTFTPDQQGDASGGAVNVVLKGIPLENILNLSISSGFNKNVRGGDWVTYDGGGVDFFGDSGQHAASDIKNGADYGDPIADIEDGTTPFDYKFSVSGGGRKEFDGFTLGGFASFFHENDSSFFDDGVEDKYYVDKDSGEFRPSTSSEGRTENPQGNSFTTSLFDTTQATEQVQWGAMGIIGLETENHSLDLTYLHTHVAEDKVTIAEDTRGKEYYYPGYDVNDPAGTGNVGSDRDSAPYLRQETVTYTERTTETLQLHGTHRFEDLPIENLNLGEFLRFSAPEIDWTISKSSAELAQPDKTQFGSQWFPDQYRVSRGKLILVEQHYLPLLPGSNANFGNYQRIWKDIKEDSDQYSLNYKQPFEQWSGDEGYLKFGVFGDSTKRKYEQESLSNTGSSQWDGAWSDTSKDSFLTTNPTSLPKHPTLDPDIDYDGEQDIFAWYSMVDLPINSVFNIIGGVRFEDTDLSIVNTPDDPASATVIYVDRQIRADGSVPSGSASEIVYSSDLADVDFSQSDLLPSIGFKVDPWETISIRGSYTETVARQTFKELSPIMQQEYLGGDIFVGNPDLQMSALENYDIRFDWKPREGSLVSASYFHKDIADPIEYVQRVNTTAGYSFTTPENYPDGKIDGVELEARYKFEDENSIFNGIGIGANATLIKSEVTLSDIDYANLPGGYKMKSRDMTNTPEHLYNIFLTWDHPSTGTSLGLFYTIRGDTLVAGAGQDNGDYIPNIYETEYGTLNFSLSQKLDDTWKMKFQAKNLLDPEIESVYRYGGEDVVKTSYSKGMEFSISLSARF